MANILLIEPDYRSKFPPLGLLRLSAYHRQKGDLVTFARGKVPALRDLRWHRIYISSLFTYELPRTVSTAKYYLGSVDSPKDLVVGGIGATLMPQYLRDRLPCSIVPGVLDRPGLLGPGTPAIDRFQPDYGLIQGSDLYNPSDAYFVRVTKGCIRKCKFCAVPILEPRFEFFKPLRVQVREVIKRYGERQDLIVLDNNILASGNFAEVIADIRDVGFGAGARRLGRRRIVDFNQGLDARLISRDNAHLLGTVCINPVRLALDYDGMKEPYSRAVRRLSHEGMRTFTTYVMFNYMDTPRSFYERLRLNVDLSENLGIRITGFPMKYAPIDDVTRRFIGPHWHWRYLRGIQCVLLATHGVVSPSMKFFNASFGESYEDFIEILCMPDRYIIDRERHRRTGASHWRRLFRKLSATQREEFLTVLGELHFAFNRKARLARITNFRSLLEHYYPDGNCPITP
jgi:hypothetical protein